jgi:hypothetical protein
MKKLLGLLLCAAALTACTRESGFGFRLPDGDPLRGRDAFVALRCQACHTVEGLDVPAPDAGFAAVALGGETTRIKTYGELVSSIINPSHRIAPGYPSAQVALNGESLMTFAHLNDVMTVHQLIDLVAFLQASYEVVPPHIGYPYIYP